ncbi:hypothetical protein CCR94_13155 [Rhodoblastus sphagnicola]|uniref:Uncharacterized protein n=1 Tax=Rhodoblastus sphagnicola TaxID=333368 RepID=A0A2S6N6M8_9HYPH|nr:hypothetical protein [Rhodoblastus sphagnicola]MBB4197628.1 hypothetical protein [Rhodoblastus sphagnicola]PPQ30264.1 hypothetical protein CCR94_13155 [Rhodoblastus sphagnicola]
MRESIEITRKRSETCRFSREIIKNLHGFIGKTQLLIEFQACDAASKAFARANAALTGRDLKWKDKPVSTGSALRPEAGLRHEAA